MGGPAEFFGKGANAPDPRQAIYDPKNTNVLEQALTGMAMGTAMQQNPNMGQLFQKPGQGGGMPGMGGMGGGKGGGGAQKPQQSRFLST